MARRPSRGRPDGAPASVDTRTVVFGIHAVAAALRRSGAVQELWLDQERRDQRLQSLTAAADATGVAPHWVDRETLERLAGSERHQGAVARLRPAEPLNEGDLEQLITETKGDLLLLVLDGVQDPHNLGACLRTADAVGVHAVVIPRDRAAGLTPVVRKVASGAAETVPFVQVTNLSRTLRLLQHAGVQLVGLAGEAESELYQADLTGPVALVMGAEGQGLRRLTRENCDLLVRIPMLGTVESLNVSVATGVCLYEALRQRRTKLHG